MKDYYKVLGVERNASEADLKKAYRKLAMEYHPDRNPGDKASEEKFKELNEAYSCLSDSQKKAHYDRFGTAEGFGAGAGFSGFGAGGFGDIFEDIFGDFFGASAGRRGPRPARGADLRCDLDITLEEAASGADKTIEVNRWEECPACGGTGSKTGKTNVCPDCMGRGQVRFQQGFFSVTKTCSKCQGRGSLISDPCAECRGQGQTQRRRKVSVRVPPGVDAGSRLKMSGDGSPGEYGGPPGDLYIVLNVLPHESLYREGMDLYCEVQVSFAEAALGTEIEVPSLEGPSKVKVPAGTQPGEKIAIKGKGMPRLGSRSRGDQIVVVRVVVPKHLNKRQKEILEEFEGINRQNSGGIKEKIKDMFAGRP